MRWRAVSSAMTLPVATSRAANRWWCRGGCSRGCRPRGPRQQRQDRGGAVQRLHLVFSSTHSTIAVWGGFRYRPTTSRTLSMNCGSVDSLKVSTRCGLSPKARQIRLMAVWDIPPWPGPATGRPVGRIRGRRSRVVTSTCSTCSSVIVRAAPGRGSSARPSRRWARTAPATWSPSAARSPTLGDRGVAVPSAQASTIRHRNANACWSCPPGPARKGRLFLVGQRQLRQLGTTARGRVLLVVFIPRPYQTSNQSTTQDTGWSIPIGWLWRISGQIGDHRALCPGRRAPS